MGVTVKKVWKDVRSVALFSEAAIINGERVELGAKTYKRIESTGYSASGGFEYLDAYVKPDKPLVCAIYEENGKENFVCTEPSAFIMFGREVQIEIEKALGEQGK
jgi:hypothetical protein